MHISKTCVKCIKNFLCLFMISLLIELQFAYMIISQFFRVAQQKRDGSITD